jgi:hypothetical protein
LDAAPNDVVSDRTDDELQPRNSHTRISVEPETLFIVRSNKRRRTVKSKSYVEPEVDELGSDTDSDSDTDEGEEVASKKLKLNQNRKKAQDREEIRREGKKPKPTSKAVHWEERLRGKGKGKLRDEGEPDNLVSSMVAFLNINIDLCVLRRSATTARRRVWNVFGLPRLGPVKNPMTRRRALTVPPIRSSAKSRVS